MPAYVCPAAHFQIIIGDRLLTSDHKDHPETGFEEIEERAVLRKHGIPFNRTSGPE